MVVAYVWAEEKRRAAARRALRYRCPDRACEGCWHAPLGICLLNYQQAYRIRRQPWWRVVLWGVKEVER